jgi:flagellar biosynthesis chaperone FliJ
MTGRGDTDLALAAVRRVRAARERDSRLGLAHALAERDRRAQAVQEAGDRLAAAAPFTGGSSGDFLTAVAAGSWLAQDLAETRVRAERAGVLAAEAGHRWQQDRRAIRVVELLLERHAEQRRAERVRAEARELDDIAGQGWLRTRGGAS